MKDGELFTCEEAIEFFPELRCLGYSASRLGILYHSRMLDGRYKPSERKHVIWEPTLILAPKYSRFIKQLKYLEPTKRGLAMAQLMAIFDEVAPNMI